MAKGRLDEPGSRWGGGLSNRFFSSYIDEFDTDANRIRET